MRRTLGIDDDMALGSSGADYIVRLRLYAVLNIDCPTRRPRGKGGALEETVLARDRAGDSGVGDLKRVEVTDGATCDRCRGCRTAVHRDLRPSSSEGGSLWYGFVDDQIAACGGVILLAGDSH